MENNTIRILNLYLVHFQGYYCLENSTTYMSTPCPVGHYCPEGTETAEQFPCEKGYYNNYTTKGSVDDCIPCDPGHYCPTSGQEVKDYGLVRIHGHFILYCCVIGGVDTMNDSYV